MQQCSYTVQLYASYGAQRIMNKRFYPSCLILLVLFCGCTVGPEHRTPPVATPATWSGVKTNIPATQPSVPTTCPAKLGEWWKSLNDPMLNSLIEQAMASNLDLRIATARVREARAQRGVVAADLWPQLNANASHTYRGGSQNAGPKTSGGLGPGKQLRNTAVNAALQGITSGQAVAPATPAGIVGQALSDAVNEQLQGQGVRASRDQNLFQLGFDASWEIDIFGGNRLAVEAATADLAATVENRRDVLISLLSDVAANYVQLRGTQRRLAIARENIRAQKDTLELTLTRFKAGFTSELDVAQAQSQLAGTESQVPLLESLIKQYIYKLSILLGQPPAALLATLEKQSPLPIIPSQVPVGLPSDLLRRRPDIRSAERQLAAATARVGAATADLFPRFFLTGSVGPQSRTINHLFDQKSLAWSVGPQITWPVFDGWRIRSNIEIQNAQQEQAVALYEKTVLTAFQDVENALVAYTHEQVRYRSLDQAVQASQRSTDLSQELYARGMTGFLNVLESQRALYASQDQLVQSETSVVMNLLALYKSLGGGWEDLGPGESR